MRVVISGYYGFGNAGDEAVLAGLLATLRETEPGSEVTVLSGDPAHTERTHAVAAIPRARPRALLTALRASDGLISGGGSLLQDRTSARPIAYYAGVMGAARLTGRPYAVLAQGLGPITRSTNRWLAASTLRGAAHVSLRDAGSVDLARSLGIRRPIEVVPDLALALRPSAPGPDGGHLLVAVRDWGESRAHLDGLREGLLRLAGRHRIVAMPMQDPADRDASLAAVAGVAGAEVVEPGLGLERQLALIGSASLVIGMRVHALILAAAAHVPAIALSYDPKVDAFATQVGQAVVGRAGERIDPDAVEVAAQEAGASDQSAYVAAVERLRAGVLPATERALDALRGREA